MCHGLVLGLLAQAGLCPHRQEAVQGDILLWKKGQEQRQKMQKTAENVTPGYHGCNPPHNAAAEREREVVQGSQGLRHGDFMVFRGHMGSQQMLQGASPGRHWL